MKKIYIDDPLIRYSTTGVSSEKTRHEIDDLLAKYDVKDIVWHVDRQHDSIYVGFKIDEIIRDVPIKVSIKVDCPTIWNRAKPKARQPKTESINWDVSMRAMYWFIYTHLNSSYAMQSGKSIAFLGYVQAAGGAQIKDLILPRLSGGQVLSDMRQ